MNSTVSSATLPVEARAVHRQFEQWRTTRPRLTRIPDFLWNAAISLYPRHSLNQIARILHLECAVLRQHLPPARRKMGKAQTKTQRFIELRPSEPGMGEYLVEVEDSAGRAVRVRLACSGVEEVMDLVRRLRQETA